MFSMFKMYCYKMFRQKSLYVIWIIMLLFINIQTVSASFAQYSADFGAFYLIFASLFPVIFFSSDISSGFIKNYAGSVSHKNTIITARSAMIVVQNILTLAVMFIGLYVVTFFRGTDSGDFGFILKYYICTFLAGLACSFISMMFTELTRKTVPAVILTVAIGTGVISQLFGNISLLISNGSFNISNFMVTGIINQLGIDSANGDFYKLILIAVCYIVISAFISIFSIEKRDVV